MLSLLGRSRQSLRRIGGVRLTWAAPGIAMDNEYGVVLSLSSLAQLLGTGIPFLDVKTQLGKHLTEMHDSLTQRGYWTTTGLLGGTINAAMRSDAVRMRRTDSCGDTKFSSSLSIGEDGVPFPKQGVFSTELDGHEWDEAPHLLAYTRELMLVLPMAINAEFAPTQDLKISNRVYGTKLAVAVGDGSKYPKHVDNACECDSSGHLMDFRKLTVIYYLNPTYQQSDGGELRLWDRDGEVVDITPDGDRLVVFWSDKCEHEVLPNINDPADEERHRWALTVWLVSDSKEAVCPNATSVT